MRFLNNTVQYSGLFVVSVNSFTLPINSAWFSLLRVVLMYVLMYAICEQRLSTPVVSMEEVATCCLDVCISILSSHIAGYGSTG